ncbi:LOW QUALITY PROTEIN: DEAD-box ATP-dependent RNA helicase FANCM-like [Apium graveolens]|uniref:LOW QUALITY PROTEIN: DEAD-box ATP-dependent RNA helicase FANCM-like n=1 Tax=Apium graveolens TaxID=4045 RepID=UPI003D7B5061
MASFSTIQIIDDDDDFDWDAAVEAIDVACQTTSNPSSNNNAVHKPPISTKQSTLDKFIGIRTPKPQLDDFSNVSYSSYRCSVVEESDNNRIRIDPEAAKTWIYPVNVPLRDYQFAITKTSLFSNTLVTLPTGLGKTLIAAVVMYNYFRWFPEGKIVFTAPSKPLVMQQIEACHNIVGIPQEWTIDLTGEMSPIKRVSFWEAKRVFFVTPQVLEKDIESGKCLVERIVCLVIDEAHRATGNYAYCVVVRKLMADNVQLRILALSATPGSKQTNIQKIIDNLQISTLEYRNESDHDVLPYVHEKKIELIKVAMGQDVVDVDNLLSEVISHICKKLSSLGVLRIRDSQTLSPVELLTAKEKFLEAPPGNVPQTRHGEISGDFFLLLKLVHMRKLLTNYGMGPALEMLEDNLKEKGNLLNRLNRSEAFQKFKILMQQSSCTGASSPKLSKMLEVLIDHFKTSDPLNSRVIIFSNYRGSVRAIMEALTNIGHVVKATQFIGQSSGKTSKGQSQKIQQEVLQKFRAGGYNVIVATSIGEEGLDIMEVDLVLCFDANVSPLRMVQRMGRTGRNHAGRVVVLACEGPEYNGYLRKQKSCQNLYKHFRNGGRTGFNFCASPRMIPHIYKPEVQYVELSIKQFIPRGKKPLDDPTVQLPTFEAELNNKEMELLSKYFQPKDNLWRPSLIAFPHFQAFPSRVHNVMHSFRSELLINAMQYLQGSSYLRNSRACFDQVEANSDLSASVETVEQHDSFMNEMQSFHDPEKDNSQREVSESHVSPLNHYKVEEKQCFTRSQRATTHVHSYLFGSDFVSVDVLGRVLVVSVPLPPLKDVHSKCKSARSADLENCYKQDAAQVGDSLAECRIEIKQANHFNATPTVQEGNGMVDIEFLDSDTQQGKSVDVDFSVSQTPVCSRKLVKEDISEGLPVKVNGTALILSDDDSENDFEDAELGPRLTSLLKSGVVPESPTNDTGTLGCKWKDEIASQDCDSTSKVHIEPISPVIVRNDLVIRDTNANEGLPSCAKDEIRSSESNGNKVAAVNCAVFPAIEETKTPAENPFHNSSSEDWQFTSGDNADSVKNGQKFKRLRKYGDILKKRPRETNQYESVMDAAELGTSTCINAHKRGRGEKRMAKDVRVFIEEQAEVSGEIPVSEDEDEEENSSYNNSFIDDRIYPTQNTSAEDSGRDMMAIYRRSLLSQSPVERPPISFIDGTPDSIVNRTQINYSGSSEGTGHSLRTPQAGLYSESSSRNPASSPLNPEKYSATMFYKNNDPQKEDESLVGSRKRKLSSCQVGPLPVQNLEGKFFLQSETQDKDRSHPDCVNRDIPVTTEFDDDQFYDGIDLDALEEQATIYLRSKSNLSTQNQMKNPGPQNHADLPSFDLGI